MKAGGARPVATTEGPKQLCEEGRRVNLRRKNRGASGGEGDREGEGKGRDALDGDALVKDFGTDGADGTKDTVLCRSVERVIREGVEGAVLPKSMSTPINEAKRGKKKEDARIRPRRNKLPPPPIPTPLLPPKVRQSRMKRIQHPVEVDPNHGERRRTVWEGLEFGVVEGGEVGGIGGTHLTHLGDAGVGELGAVTRFSKGKGEGKGKKKGKRTTKSMRSLKSFHEKANSAQMLGHSTTFASKNVALPSPYLLAAKRRGQLSAPCTSKRLKAHLVFSSSMTFAPAVAFISAITTLAPFEMR